MSNWDYAMILYHRTKKQIDLYEGVISILADEEARKDFEELINRGK